MSNPLFEALFSRHVEQETAFLLLPDGTVWSHKAFLTQAAQYAHVLHNEGVRAGDRVAVQVAKSPHALALYAACVQGGFIFLPLNPAYTAEELSYFVSDSDATLLICDPDQAQSLTPVAAQTGAVLETLGASGEGSLSDKAKDQPPTFEPVMRDEGDLAALLYTSGTTGRSKGAMLTQANLLSNALSLVDVWQFSDRDVLLHVLPIFHTHGLFVATNIMLIAGGSMVFMPRFDLNDVLAWMPRATSMMGVPTHYTRLLEDTRLSCDLTGHMRLFISGSAPLLADTHARFKARTGHDILERYGMTETSMNTSNPYDGVRRAGTVGFPLPGVDLKITDPDTGAICPPDAVGQIEVRGPNVFKGYWRMPEKTAEELRPDGFFITGDLGLIDAQGYVHIVGRGKDLIISGGFNIYPKEIELLLDAQPGVLESAVIGVPHLDLGEAVVGVIVAQKDVKPDALLIEDTAFASLARFKHPRQLVFCDALPRNAMGKVQKAVLRDTYRHLFAPEKRLDGN